MASKPAYRKKLAEKIREFRKGKNFSQEKLAELADLHHNSIGQIERAEIDASVGTLVKLSKALSVRVRDLVEEL